MNTLHNENAYQGEKTKGGYIPPPSPNALPLRAAPELPLIISKKFLVGHFNLGSRILWKRVFEGLLADSLSIDKDQYKKIREFSLEQSHVIRHYIIHHT